MKIREFAEKDAAPVAQIMYDSFKSFLGDRMWDPGPSPVEEWKVTGAHTKSRLEEGISYVAEDDSGKVIGFLQVGINVCRLGVLHQIGVDPGTFAKGVGTALFRKAEEEFWLPRKVRKVYTCTSSINPRAQAFYKKVGFVQEGILKDHFFDGVDEIQLSKFY